MLLLQQISYAHPNGDLLFDGLQLHINKGEKIALIGDNGTGKSTLLRLMAGQLQPSSGKVICLPAPYYLPQVLTANNHLTIAQTLGIDAQLKALHAILAGDASAENMALLDDHWDIEERCQAAFNYWQLYDLPLDALIGTLSGGQKTKVLLAGIMIHAPEIVLLDEPSNHLDAGSRQLLYEYIRTSRQTLVVISHDKTLLRLLSYTCALSAKGLTKYGGNYDFYREQKNLERQALQHDLQDSEKALRKAKETERKAMERQQKLDARGRKKQDRSGVPTIALNTLRNQAEQSTARMKELHAGKVTDAQQEVQALRKAAKEQDKMRLSFDDATMPRGKLLLELIGVHVCFDDRMLWPLPVTFRLYSGDRVALKGANGSGKTSLLRLMLGELKPSAGIINSNMRRVVYIDQEYSLLNDELTVREQAMRFNTGHLEDHELNRRLTHFLFGSTDWSKQCAVLSGGERMRLLLCCISLQQQAPHLIILDEPTNNLDLQNIEILTATIRSYEGTLLVVSHDASFLAGIDLKRELALSS